jgi:hypothetical protein
LFGGASCDPFREATKRICPLATGETRNNAVAARNRKKRFMIPPSRDENMRIMNSGGRLAYLRGVKR